MKILVLNWKDLKNPNVGGAEIIVFELCKRLVEEGNEVICYSRTFPGAKKEEFIDGIRVVRRGGTITTYLHAVFFYRNLSPKPDLVIDMVNTLCWQTPLYIREKKLIYVNQLAKEVLKYELPFPLSTLAYYFERFQYLTYKKVHFICYSNSTKEDIIDMGISPTQVHVFPLGLDHIRYLPAKKADTPLFAYVGRFVKMKRVDLCIRAMVEVIKVRPDTVLAIIGYGPDESRLIKLVNSLGLTNNVYFINKDNLFFKKDPKDKKTALMQQSWALLLPSVKEGWGMVVTEANACGTPAIVSNVTGLKDAVSDGKTGIIISKNPSSKELAEAMLRIINDTELRRNLSTHAISWAKKFTWASSFKQFVKILERTEKDQNLPKTSK